MKFSVIGAGAIGSMFGGLIKHHSSEVDVVLVARGEHRAKMQQQGGVRLTGPWGEVTAPVTVAESPEQIAGSDVVMLSVKSYATEEALSGASPYLSDATLISMQNGINQHTIMRTIPPQRLVMGMTAGSYAVTEPGTVDLRHDDVSIIGPVSEETESANLQAAAEMLRRSQLKIEIDPHIVGAQYNKLIVNTLGAANSLADADFIRECVLDHRWRNQIALPLQAEALRVLPAAGVELSRVPGGSDVWRFRRMMKTMNVPMVGWILRQIVAALFRNKQTRFSLRGDLLRGGPTEVDFINGEIVRLAEKAGTTAPYNAKVIELVRQCESQGLMTKDQVIQIFGSMR